MLNEVEPSKAGNHKSSEADLAVDQNLSNLKKWLLLPRSSLHAVASEVVSAAIVVEGSEAEVVDSEVDLAEVTEEVDLEDAVDLEAIEVDSEVEVIVADLVVAVVIEVDLVEEVALEVIEVDSVEVEVALIKLKLEYKIAGMEEEEAEVWVVWEVEVVSRAVVVVVALGKLVIIRRSSTQANNIGNKEDHPKMDTAVHPEEATSGISTVVVADTVVHLAEGTVV